jgi:AcrR family transcriptional regulator
LELAQIVEAAQRLLEERGLEDFSLRKLAAELGVKSPSLYWHVRDKQELFDLVADWLLAECPLPDPSLGWSESLARLARDLRRVLLAHPVAAGLLPGRTPFGPGELRLAEATIGVLRGAGFGERLAGYGYLILTFYAIGFATQELAFGKGPEARDRLAKVSRFLSGLPAEHYPNLVAVADEFTAPGLTDRFETGLAGVLEGLRREHELAKSRGKPPTADPGR